LPNSLFTIMFNLSSSPLALIKATIFRIQPEKSDKFIFCEVVIAYLNRLWPRVTDGSEIMIVSLW